LKAQVDELKRKLGDVTIVTWESKVPNAEFVISLAKQEGARYIVPVLPLSIIAKLVDLAKKEGITVLWAEMEQQKMMFRPPVSGKDYNPECETVVVAMNHNRLSYKIMRFKKFHKIKSVKLELESL